MAVVARFYVQAVERYAHSLDAYTVKLQAVSRGEENKSWASATPYGVIQMNINNGPAGKWFDDRLGKDVSITIDEVDDEEAHSGPYG